MKRLSSTFLLQFLCLLLLLFPPLVARSQSKPAQPNSAQPNPAQPNSPQPNSPQPNSPQPNSPQPNSAQPKEKLSLEKKKKKKSSAKKSPAPPRKRKIIASLSELLGFRWNYFGLSHQLTFDLRVKDLWNSNHFLLNSHLKMGLRHYFSSMNALKIYVGFQPFSIFEINTEARIFHTYGQFNSISRMETYDEYSKEFLDQWEEIPGNETEVKYGISFKASATLKLKFWKIILVNTIGAQFFSVFGFNDDKYKPQRFYYYESISVKHLYVNDFIIFNESYLFFEIFNNPRGRSKLLAGFYNEFLDAPNYYNPKDNKKDKEGKPIKGDPTNKLGLMVVWTPIEHIAMPTVISKLLLWMVDRYKGLDAKTAPEFEFVLAVSWDFDLGLHCPK